MSVYILYVEFIAGPTSVSCKGFVNHTDDGFTIYSHTDHCCHILPEVLCGERPDMSTKKKLTTDKAVYHKMNISSPSYSLLKSTTQH